MYIYIYTYNHAVYVVCGDHNVHVAHVLPVDHVMAKAALRWAGTSSAMRRGASQFAPQGRLCRRFCKGCTEVFTEGVAGNVQMT